MKTTYPEGYEDDTPLQFSSKNTGSNDFPHLTWSEELKHMFNHVLPYVIIGRSCSHEGRYWNEVKARLVSVSCWPGTDAVTVWHVHRRNNIHTEWTADRSLTTNLHLDSRQWFKYVTAEDRTEAALCKIIKETMPGSFPSDTARLTYLLRHKFNITLKKT